MTLNGYMKGYTDQTFKTGNPITRAEATVALNNVTGSIYNKPGTYGDKTVEGNVSVSSDSVNLKNLNIKGNLYLTEGIGDGTVVLDNVTVSGKTLVCGGGMESIIIKNSTLGATVVQKKDGKVRLEASGKTKVGKMQLRSGGKLEEKDLSDAGFEDVEVKKDKSDAIVQFDGDFNNVDILSESKIEVTKGNIAKLQANEEAKDAEIKVLAGKIESIEIYPELDTVSSDVYMTYQWYRVNPVSYEMTAIDGATDLTYITTGDDVGYNMLVRATGDDENISGFIQVMSSWGVLEQNNACISNATNSGFTLNLYKTVPGLTASELSLIDYNGDSVTVNSVTQGANAAIYNISADLDPAKGPFYLSNNSDFWKIASAQEGHMMISEGIQIPYSVERYAITVADVVGGAASVGTTPNIEAAEGEIITVYILNIEEGKEFKSITVTGVESGEVETTPITGGAEYTFTMPAEEVTVTVVIE